MFYKGVPLSLLSHKSGQRLFLKWHPSCDLTCQIVSPKVAQNCPIRHYQQVSSVMQEIGCLDRWDSQNAYQQ